MKKTLRNTLLLMAGVCLVTSIITRNFIGRVVVVGNSMNPTFQTSESGYVNRIVLKFRTLQRGEIIIFHDNLDKTLVVKRVIGIPGDTISLSFGKVYVNGKLLSEPYLKNGTLTLPRNYNNLTLESNQYFMMGDNRSNSMDSRDYGPVSISNVVGLFVR